MKMRSFLVIIALTITKCQDCSLGYYYNSTLSACEPCHSSCLTNTYCFGPDPIDCLDCGSDSQTYIFHLESLKCVLRNQSTTAQSSTPSSQSSSSSTTASQSSSACNYCWVTTNYSYFNDKFPYQVQYISSVYLYQNGTMMNQYDVLRNTVIFVDPQGVQSLELGTAVYPYKNLTQAFVDIYNQFLMINGVFSQVLIAFEQSSTISLTSKQIVDGINLTITTYNKSSSVINYLNSDNIYQQMPSISSLNIQYTSTQSSSSYQLISSYFYLLSLKSNQLANQRSLLQLSKLRSYGGKYFNVFNAQLKITNFNISISVAPNTFDQLITLLQGGDGNSFSMMNCIYSANMKLVKSYTLATIEILSSSIDMGFLAQSLIVQNSFHGISGLCPSTYLKGAIVIKACVLQGQYLTQDEYMIQSEAFTDLVLSDNIVDKYSFSRPLLSFRVIGTVCQTQFSSSIAPLIFNVSNNTFQNQIVNIQNYLGFKVVLAQDLVETQILFQSNSFIALNSQWTVLDIQSYQSSTPLIFQGSVSLNNFSQSGDETHFLNLYANCNASVAFDYVSVQNSSLERLIKLQTQLGSLSIQSLKLTNVNQTSSAYQPRYILSIPSCLTLTISSFGLSQSSFINLVPLDINQIGSLTISDMSVVQNSLNQGSLVRVQNISQLLLSSVQITGNTVAQYGQARIFDIEKLICKIVSTVQISQVAVSSNDQLPFILIREVQTTDPSINHTFTFSNMSVQSSTVTTANYFEIGPSSALNVQMSFVNITFASNNIPYFALIKIATYSQLIEVENLSFTNNQAQLLFLAPNSIASLSSSFNQYMSVTGVVIQGNTNQLSPIIELQNGASIKLQGQNSQISNNAALSKKGLIFLGEDGCQLETDSIAFSGNFAYYGGVFTASEGGLITCSNCQFDNNYAFKSSIANLYTNGRIILSGCTIGQNVALFTQLFSFSNSIREYSSFTNVIFQSQLNTMLSLTQRYSQLKQVMSSFFPQMTDFSVLYSEFNGQVQEFRWMWLQNSKLQIINCLISDYTRFIQTGIDAQIIIEESQFTHQALSDNLMITIKSSMTISSSNFTSIQPTISQVNGFYLINALEQSQVLIQNNTLFSNVNVSLIQLHRSTLSMENCTIFKVTFQNDVIDAKLSPVTLINTTISNVSTSSPTNAIILLEQGSTFTVQSLVIDTFNSLAIDISDSQSQVRLTLYHYLRSKTQLFRTQIPHQGYKYNRAPHYQSATVTLSYTTHTQAVLSQGRKAVRYT